LPFLRIWTVVFAAHCASRERERKEER
jgi:hypothetical protein